MSYIFGRNKTTLQKQLFCVTARLSMFHVDVASNVPQWKKYSHPLLKYTFQYINIKLI